MNRNKKSLKNLNKYACGITKEGTIEPRSLKYKLLRYRTSSKNRDKLEKMLYDNIIPSIEGYNAYHSCNYNNYDVALYHFLGCTIRMDRYYPSEDRYFYKKSHCLEIDIISDEHHDTNPIEEFFNRVCGIKFKKTIVGVHSPPSIC